MHRFARARSLTTTSELEPQAATGLDAAGVEAFSWLDKAFEQRNGWLIHIRENPRYDSLREDPRPRAAYEFFRDRVDTETVITIEASGVRKLRGLQPALELARDAAVAAATEKSLDEITEVENETELIGGRRALILEDHPQIAVEPALIDALAADEGEIDRPWITRQRRGDRPADAATVPLSIGEAAPVDAAKGHRDAEQAGSS